jgi:hypothetical protein
LVVAVSFELSENKLVVVIRVRPTSSFEILLLPNWEKNVFQSAHRSE